MDEIVGILAVGVTGPLVGSEFAVAAFVNPIAGRLPDAGFRAVRSDAGRVLGKVMPFWYGASAVMLLGAAVFMHSRLIGVAVALMVVIMAVTVTVLVPINNRIAAWSLGGEPSRDLAARWDRLHWMRVVLLVVIFVLLAGAVIA